MTDTEQPKRKKGTGNYGKFDLSKEEILDLWLREGTKRTIPNVHKTYSKMYSNLPTMATMRKWSREGNWQAIAEDYDKRFHEEMLSRSAAAAADKVFNARQKLEDNAELLLKRAENYLSDDNLAKITNYDDLTQAMKMAVEAIKLAEVLRGNVSDRKSVAVEISEEERKKELQDEFDKRIEAVKGRVVDFQKRVAGATG